VVDHIEFAESAHGFCIKSKGQTSSIRRGVVFKHSKRGVVNLLNLSCEFQFKDVMPNVSQISFSLGPQKAFHMTPHPDGGRGKREKA